MKNLTTDDLLWMINKNFLGANMFQIVVTDVNPDRAQRINQAIIDEFLKNDSENMRMIYIEAAVAGFLLALLFWGAFWFYCRKSDQMDNENVRKEKDNGQG